MENSNNLPSKPQNQSLAKRFDKFVTNVKFINYLIFAILLAFVVVFAYVSHTWKENDRIRAEQAKNQKELYSSYYENSVLSSGQDIIIPEIDSSDRQLFANGKQAVIYAFNMLYNAKSYEMEYGGKSYASAAGTSRTVDTNGYSYKYLDGMQFDRNFRKDYESIANQSAAFEIIYKDGKKYQREGSLTTKNGKLDGNFSGPFIGIASKVTSHPFYVITDKTIKKCNSFNIQKNNGKIEYYQVSIELDPPNATKDYSTQVMEEGGTSYPSFSYIYMDIKINANGRLLSYVTKEEMTVSKTVPVLGSVTATTKNVITTTVHSVNGGNPSYQQPKL